MTPRTVQTHSLSLLVLQNAASTQRCCYNAVARQSSTDVECVFNVQAEYLIKVGDQWFCPYHLPWSPVDLAYRFGIQIPDDDPSRPLLKDRWPEIKKASFQNNLMQRITQTDGNIDLAGVVLAGDFKMEEVVCRSYLNIADSYFPGNVYFRNVHFFGPISNPLTSRWNVISDALSMEQSLQTPYSEITSPSTAVTFRATLRLTSAPF
jgi:hypothetical protein